MNPKIELVRVLEERGLADLAARAKLGEYSDFASPHVTPVVMLVNELASRGHLDLAERARNGDFDHER